MHDERVTGEAAHRGGAHPWRSLAGMLLVALVGMLAWAAVPARAATVVLDGSRMNVSVDEGGHLQARLDGHADGEFYPPDEDPAVSGPTFVVYPGEAGTSPSEAFGLVGDEVFTAVSGPEVDSTSTTLFATTTFQAGPYLQITQRIALARDATSFEVRYTVRTISDSPVRFRAFASADLHPRTDNGVGFLDPSPLQRRVGATDALTGDLGVIGELRETPWSAFQEGAVSPADVIGNAIRSEEGLNNTVDPRDVDAGVAVQWDTHLNDPLFPPDGSFFPTATFAHTWEFVEQLVATPTDANAEVRLGRSQTVDVVARTPEGFPEHQPIGWVQDGPAGTRRGFADPNPDTGEVRIPFTSPVPGADTVTLFIDRDFDGVHDPNPEPGEPRQTVRLTWSAWRVDVTPSPGIGAVGRPFTWTVSSHFLGEHAHEGPVPRFRYRVVRTGGAAGPFAEQTAGDGVERTVTHESATLGTDRLEIFVDGDGDDTRDADELPAAARLDWGEWSLALAPSSLAGTIGDVLTFTATPSFSLPSPPPGSTSVRYAFAPTNLTSGAVTIASPGQPLPIEQRGRNVGSDTLTAWVDVDDDGTLDPNEPQRQATATWNAPSAPPPPPPPPPNQNQPQQQQQQQQQLQQNQNQSQDQDPQRIEQLPDPGKDVFNAEADSGRIRVRLPNSNQFVDLREAGQLPEGTVVDARNGRLELETLADQRTGATQSGIFFAGVFALEQAGSSKPVTTLRLAGANPAPPRVRRGVRASAASIVASAAARPRKRRLWGDAKGNFRSRGNFSAATVRGTKWLVEDLCDSTLTRVTEGTVTVRDFAKRRNVRLRKGQTYRARSPGKRCRRGRR